jgi:hypothetical protein
MEEQEEILAQMVGIHLLAQLLQRVVAVVQRMIL